MSGIAQAMKQAVTSKVQSQKAADLQAVTVEPGTNSRAHLTTDHGVPVSNTDTWLKVSDGSTVGPALLEDQIAREKIMRFDHERIPERVVHARGTAAHGYFKVYDDRASKYTTAGVLTGPSRTTPTFVRFSTVQGSRGSADTVRDARGFATKFYTKEGNWDLVGNDIPVFFIQDAIQFPDIIHAVKPEPHNEVPQGQSAHNNFWDFCALQSQASHMVMWAMSDRGIPRSYRMMQGFGVNTFTLVNSAGERVFVKFHWIPELGVHSLMWDEALKIGGQDPDFHRKDLQEAIENGAYPKWQFAIQTIPEAREHDFDFDILDATKVWPEELVPLEVIGEMVLDRMVDEFFPETEQVAFCTAHVVPGIGFSDDPLLQGRNFSYFDTQISRLGVNFQQIPINRPVCPVFNHQRDGQMQMRIVKSNVNYHPNRHDTLHPVAVEAGGFQDHVQKIHGMAQRKRGAKFEEHFNQAQMFFHSLAPHEKKHLIDAISFELSHCDDKVVYEGYTRLLSKIDFELAKQVATNVGGIAPESPASAASFKGRPSAPLSQMYYAPKTPTIKSRRIAILVADGVSGVEVTALRGLISSASATSWVIGPRRGSVAFAGEGSVQADHHYEGQRSTMFDALVIPSGAAHVKALSANGRAVHWVREAFGHCKAIGAVGEAVAFLRDVVQLPGVKFADERAGGDEVVSSYGVVTTARYSVASAATDALKIGEGEKGFLPNFAYEVSKHRCWEREMEGLTAGVAY